jgi:hypothetical protein
MLNQPIQKFEMLSLGLCSISIASGKNRHYQKKMDTIGKING